MKCLSLVGCFLSWDVDLVALNHQYLLLSYILNDKIKELKVKLADSIDSITINGKIYNKKLDDFTYIYSELINLEKHNMN